jgi:hypothetical protein
MPRERPGSVLTLAILHLIGGGLGLLVAICAGVGLAMLGVLFSGGQAPPGMGQDPNVQLHLYLQKNVPSYEIMMVADTVMAFVLAIMLLSCGMGLLFMQPWARYASFVYAVLSILRKLVVVPHQLLVVYPAVRDCLQIIKQQGPAQAGFANTYPISFLGGLALNAAFIIYPITVIVVLMMPGVAQAFRQDRRRERDEEDEGGDRYPDAGDRWADRERRRGRDQDRDEDREDRGDRYRFR